MTLTRRAAWTRALVLMAAIVAADQALKAIVNGAIERGDSAAVVLGIKLVNVRNSGVAFGQLEDGGLIVGLAVGVATSALLVYFALHATRRWMWIPTGMLLGGAVGNAIDRVAEGAVIDFVKLPAWPAFNVADICITFGVLVLLFVMDRADADRRPA